MKLKLIASLHHDLTTSEIVNSFTRARIPAKTAPAASAPTDIRYIVEGTAIGWFDAVAADFAVSAAASAFSKAAAVFSSFNHMIKSDAS